jgi:predicted Zn-dependent protease
VDWYRQQPEDSLRSEAFRYGFARTLYHAGALDEARQLFEVLATEQPDSVSYRGYLGAIAAKEGEGVRARQISESLSGLARPYLYGQIPYWQARIAARLRARQISESLSAFERPYLFGQIPYWQARIAARVGDRDEAVRLLRRAFAEGGFHDHVHADADLQSLSDYRAYRELLEPRN